MSYQYSTQLHDLMVTGADPNDEVFKNIHYGAFNATSFKRLLAGKPHRFSLVRVQIDEQLVSYIKGFIDINEEHVAAMSTERRDQPLYAVTIRTLDPPLLIIDGHHRLVRRYYDGFDFANAWQLPSRMLPLVEVQYIKVRK